MNIQGSGFPKTRGNFFGVPMLRNITIFGAYIRVPIFVEIVRP